MLQYCTPSQLRVDPAYQRQLDDRSARLIRTIASRWDWRLCQPLSVACRQDGRLFVVDGQHRLEAARMRGDIQQLPCVVTHSTSAADEAQAFVALNQSRRPLTAYALFNAAVAGGDEQAVTLARLIASAGLQIVGAAGFQDWKPGQVNNISAIRTFHARQGDTLTRRVLTCLARGFPDQVIRYCGTLFGAIGGFAGDHDGQFEDDLLVAVLQGATQAEWLGEFAKASTLAGVSRRHGAVAAIADAYAEAMAQDDGD